MAARSGYGKDAEPIIKKVLAETPNVIQRIRDRLPNDFPDRVAARIFEGLQGSAQRLAAMPPK